MHNDFDRRVLEDVAHRPWPMPARPWVMTQTWHDLLFAHWPIDAPQLASKVPPGLELECFDDRAWLGIVPFRMTNVAPRGVPAPTWLSAFPELNVRTYVSAGGKPGVYFFSLDATNVLAVVAARTMFHLPYYAASMQVQQQGESVTYRSRRTGGTPPRESGGSGWRGGAHWASTYRPTGPVFHPVRGSLEHFLTERYCLYAVDSRSRVLRVDIHHPSWPLQQAEAEITANTMADAAGISLPATAPLLHFARRQDTVAWRPMRV
jgi:uncharacterized protein YqjF (DUF2071 family)